MPLSLVGRGGHLAAGRDVTVAGRCVPLRLRRSCVCVCVWGGGGAGAQHWRAAGMHEDVVITHNYYTTWPATNSSKSEGVTSRV
jgi:hypothetical protein